MSLFGGSRAIPKPLPPPLPEPAEDPIEQERRRKLRRGTTRKETILAGNTELTGGSTLLGSGGSN